MLYGVAPERIRVHAWLVRRESGENEERLFLARETTRLGRDPSNDVAIRGRGADVVSSRHCEIRRVGSRFQVYDLGSTNGLLVNGSRVESAALEADDVIELGPGGPAYRFEIETLPSEDLEGTVAIQALEAREPPRAAPVGTRANLTRKFDETAKFLRGRFGPVPGDAHLNMRRAIVALVVVLVAVAAYAAFEISRLRAQRGDIDRQIAEIEQRLAFEGADAREIDSLLARLERYQAQAKAIQENVLVQLTDFDRQQVFIEGEMRRLLREFGAEQYSVPPDFSRRVGHYVRSFQEQERPVMTRALERARGRFNEMRRIFAEENLPPDLAYMALVESALINNRSSSAGAVGLWQFTAPTARQYGLRVNDEVDERLDPEKATRAAVRYLRELILDFGSGSSIMLALAAYNVGPQKVKRAVRRVEDPILQRNFWRLYRTQTLPAETREYVPKALAAMIIGRNPDRFGF